MVGSRRQRPSGRDWGEIGGEGQEEMREEMGGDKEDQRGEREEEEEEGDAQRAVDGAH